MFSFWLKPSDIVFVWCSCVVNRVAIGARIVSKVPWGSSVHNFMKKYEFCIPMFIFWRFWALFLRKRRSQDVPWMAPVVAMQAWLMKNNMHQTNKSCFATTIVAFGFNMTNGCYIKVDKFCCLKFVLTTSWFCMKKLAFI